ncbi:hypothetical protein C8R47DRAFT_1086941 [Mycena vitilis]|nr:hypothetical protein C8R47DRAFT_1086941 [Mycena vitilis]
MSAKKSNGGAKKAEQETFDTRDVVLGKVRGFPAWPGMIVDPTTIPRAVVKARPASKKGTVYVVRFFPTGDYAWLTPKDITPLKSAQINAYVTQQSGAGARKAGELMEGYKIALDPDSWEAEQAANPPTAKKRKSKSQKQANDEEEEEEEVVDEEEEGEEEPEKAGKKRKRAASPAPKAAKAKRGGKGKKSKATVESEDEGAEAEAETGREEGANKKVKTGDGAAANPEADPDALKVREWRHKLQKTFLGKALPKEEEMPAVDALFATVEGFQNMSIEYLMFSKIGKVMRHIHLLEPGKVPRDDDFKFRDRAKALVDKWHAISNAKAADGEGAAAAAVEGTSGEVNAAGDVAAEGEGEGEGDLTMMDVTMNGEGEEA